MADEPETMKPIQPNDQDKYNQQIIQFRVDPDTGFYTLSCSTDNGLHYQDILTAYGRKFSDKDAVSFWPFLKKYVSSLIDGVTIEWSEVKGKPEVITKEQLEERLAKLAIPTSFSWSDITDKPSDLVNEQALQDVKSTASSAKELAEKNASLLDNKADVGQIPKTMSWDSITEKPRLALESDIPSLDGYAKLSQIPSIDGLVREAELTAYAKHNELPVIPTDLVHSAELDKANADIAQAKQMATDAAALANNAVKETELVNYAKKSDLPDVSELAKTDTVEAIKATAESALSKAEEAQSTADANSKALADKVDRNELPVIPTDLVHTAELEQARADITKAEQMANDAVALANNARTTIDTSNIHQIKKPSEYSEGFSYEVKALSDLGIDLTKYDTSVQNGWIGLVKSVRVSVFNSVYVTQTVRVLGSYRPTTFIRNGSGDSWYPFELVTTW